MKNLKITLASLIVLLVASTFAQAQSESGNLNMDSTNPVQSNSQLVIETGDQTHVWVGSLSEETLSREVILERNSISYQLADVRIFLYAGTTSKSRWEDSLTQVPFTNK